MSPTITMPELKEAEGQLAERRSKLKAIFEEAGPTIDLTKVKSLDGDSAARVEVVRALDVECAELATKVTGLRGLKRIAEDSAVDELGPGVEPGGDDKKTGRKSFSGEFLKSDAYKTKGSEATFDLELKDLMSTDAGWAPWSERRDTVIDIATRPVELFDLIPTVPTGATGSIDYFEETTLTNNAAETAEGGTYGEAVYELTERSANIRKIAVFLPVTDEQLADVPRLQGRLDNRMPFMVRQRASLQIAQGDGNAPNLMGVTNLVGTQTQAKSTDPTPDAVFKAMTKVQVTGEAVPDAYLTNPLDWQDVRLLRTSDGIYIWGSPSDVGPARIWGLKVVSAQACPQNTGVVGDFGNYSELSVRKDVTVAVGLVNDDFKKGRQSIRADMRVALIWYRPAAFCLVTGI